MPFCVGRPLLNSTFPTRASTLGGSLSGKGASLPGSCAAASTQTVSENAAIMTLFMTSSVAIAGALCQTWRANSGHCLFLASDFEISRFPASVEGGLLGSVDAEVSEPAFAGDRLNPLAFLARWSGRTKEQIDCATTGAEARDLRFDFKQRAQGRFALTGVDLGARVRVIHGHRPK